MFCDNCGQQLADGTAFCPHCGAAVTVNTPQPPMPPNAPPPYWQGQPFYRQPYPIPPKPSAGWLVFNIVLMVFSGFSNILAIVGVVFGALGQSAYNHGDYKDAESKTRTCKVLGIISLVLFLLAVVFLVLLFLLGSASSSPYVYSNL